MRHKIQMIGSRYGCLIVLEQSNTDSKSIKYLVRCELCSEEKEMYGGNIRRVSKTGGGCTCTCTKNKVHGLWRHPAYKTWNGIIHRCYQDTHVAYHRYGGRGIGVCEEWRYSPIKFIEWLNANGWEKGLQVDRIDNDKSYSPENCRVVEPIINANNKSNNRTIYVAGETLTISEAARKFGVNKTTIKERLNRGWSDSMSVGVQI